MDDVCQLACACVRVSSTTKLSDDDDEKRKNIKFRRSDGITAPAIKYRGLYPLEKFARGCISCGGVNLFGIRANCNNGRFDVGE